LSVSSLPPCALRRPSTNNSGSWSKASFLHLAICMRCTLNCGPSWLSVLLPRIASNATRALNFALYCLLVIVDFSLVNDSVEILIYCLVKNHGTTIKRHNGRAEFGSHLAAAARKELAKPGPLFRSSRHSDAARPCRPCPRETHREARRR